ncbi:cspA [Symbiodinium microadriaticum]|nr:cspA [Symbiodinium microadriaticum]CAE7942590.1 cspA [Symbiodinium sp. KB8]
MPNGFVTKWSDRGFGFIAPEGGGEDVFVHGSVLRGDTSLQAGDRVYYETRLSRPNGRKQGHKASAISCRRVVEDTAMTTDFFAFPSRRDPAVSIQHFLTRAGIPKRDMHAKQRLLRPFMKTSSVGCPFLVISERGLLESMRPPSASELKSLLELLTAYVQGCESSQAFMLADFEGEMLGYCGELSTAAILETSALDETLKPWSGTCMYFPNSEFSSQIGRTAVITLSVAILGISRSARIFDRRRGNRQISDRSNQPCRSLQLVHSAAGISCRFLSSGCRGGLYTSGQAQPPDQQTAPPAASGDWGSGWNRDDRRRAGGDQATPDAHNPFAVQKTDFVEQVVVDEADCNRNSLLVIDSRDERLISPFQKWLVEAIMAIAARSINVLTARDQVMPPNSGYHCSSPFANYTLDGIKAVLVFTRSSKTGGPCAQWGSYASRALFHSAFQPFTCGYDPSRSPRLLVPDNAAVEVEAHCDNFASPRRSRLRIFSLRLFRVWTEQIPLRAVLRGPSPGLSLPFGVLLFLRLGLLIDLRTDCCIQTFRPLMQSPWITKVMWGADADFESLMHQEIPISLNIHPQAVIDIQLAYSTGERRLAMARMLERVPAELLVDLPSKSQIDWHAHHSRNQRALHLPLSCAEATYAMDDLHRIEAQERRRAAAGSQQAATEIQRPTSLPCSGKILAADFPAPETLDIPGRARVPLFRARCCVFGLLCVEALRLLAARTFPSPGGLELTAQILTSASNSLACVGSLPVFASQSLGVCVNRRCLGSLLTLILTSSMCTWGAVVIDILPGGGWQRLSAHALLDEGAPSVIGFLGVWECLLLASVSLQSALCISAWTFYRMFRELGLYPPGQRKGRIHAEVSALEFVCEAEDVALLSDQCNGNCQREPLPREDACPGPEVVFAMAVAAEASMPPAPPRGLGRDRLHEDDVRYPST